MSDSTLVVSVIVLTYNHERFIKEALESVIRQKTNFPFEIVVANDASPDSTESVVADYRSRYPQLVKGYNNQTNMGGAANFEKAYAHCKGKYIAICEGDDYWTDDSKLQKQVDFLEAHLEFVVAFHDAIVVDSNGQITEQSKLSIHRLKNISADQLLRGAFMPTASVLFRPVIKKFPDSFVKMLNTDTFLWALLGGSGGAAFIKEVGPSVYRIHAGGIYSGKSQLMRSLKRVESMGYMEQYFGEQPEIAAHYRRNRRKLALNCLKLVLKTRSVGHLGMLFKYTYKTLS